MKRQHPKGRKAVSLHLPFFLYEEIAKKLHDPVYGKIKYGAFSTLVTNLLATWLEEQKVKTQALIDLIEADNDHIEGE